MPFKIIRNDIIHMQVDAIVNTANCAPTYGSGVDYAVYKAAGEEALLEARREIGYMKQGEVAVTPGFDLPAKYIIHAVSPRYVDGESGEEVLLRECYSRSLRLAQEYGCKSIAFPLISSGAFGYPKEEAMRIAVDEIHAFLLQEDMDIFLVVFDDNTTRLGRNLYPQLENYIDNHYVRVKQAEEYYQGESGTLYDIGADAKEWGIETCMEKSLAPPRVYKDMGTRPTAFCEAPAPETDYDDFWEKQESALQERMKHLSDTFQQYLFYLIENKALSNAQVYKAAIVDKKLFSKIKQNPQYHPDKVTAMRLCVGARLNLDETKDLLARAGYALSPCDKRDIIFAFFIENEIYDMIELDIALEEHDLPCFIQ